MCQHVDYQPAEGGSYAGGPERGVLASEWRSLAT